MADDQPVPMVNDVVTADVGKSPFEKQTKISDVRVEIPATEETTAADTARYDTLMKKASGTISKGVQRAVIGFLGAEEEEEAMKDEDKRKSVLAQKYASKWQYKTQQRKKKRLEMSGKWKGQSIYFTKKIDADPEELSLQAGHRDSVGYRDSATADAAALAEFAASGAAPPKKGGRKPRGGSKSQRGSVAKSGKKQKKKGAKDEKAHKAYFIWLVTIVDVGMLALTIIVGGFAPWPSVNPFGGPPTQTLIDYGAKYGPPMLQDEEWRFFTAMFLHVGVIHLVLNMGFQLQVGKQLEQTYGMFRVAPIYIISGMGGNLVSAVFVPNSVVVGASGALYGFIGVLLVDLIQNWKHIPKPKAALFRMLLMILFSLAIGLLPMIDNFAHIGGMYFGILSSVVFLPTVNFGYWSAKVKGFLVLLFAPLTILSAWLLWYIFNNDVDAYGWCPVCGMLNCLPIMDWCDNV